MNCFLDYRITKEELVNLLKLNLNPIIIPKTDRVYKTIDGHVDIQFNIIDSKSKTVIVHNGIEDKFLTELNTNDINYIISQNELKNNYPENIILNALILDDYFIHNIKYTDTNLINSIKDKKIINVKQGYTKCSVLPLNNRALITSDIGIYNKLKKEEDFDILLLPPGDILLPSLNYGFIGGVGGMVSDNKLALFGELKEYSYGNEMIKFLKKYDIEPISLRKGKLIDRGSLLCL